MKEVILTITCVLFAGIMASVASAVNIETVPVGNPGNAGEWSGESYGGWGPDRICGAVHYEYRIGQYEVTAGQYAEFLNAVAATDDYGLYNTEMDVDNEEYGCNIKRSSFSGSYTYSVAADWANRPVNFVSFWDACRFANWLHNGQGTGGTEDGAYTLTPDGIANNTVTRNVGWKWAVPSEDEWYKAAYHKNDGVTGNYFDYPTNSDTGPSNDLIDPDPGNNATLYDYPDFTIGSPYYRTEVEAHENSENPYGTFDQAGNVWELNETIIIYLGGSYRGQRGGSFSFADAYEGQHAANRVEVPPAFECHWNGFRVCTPEPGGIVMLAFASVGLLRSRRAQKH